MESDRSTFNTRPSPRRPPILVGREPEQIFLREELAAAATGHGRFVLLGGEAGIGKTTLAQDLVREAELQGQLILTGYCYDLTNTPPYGPWLDLFAGYPESAALPAPPPALAGGVLARVADQSALFTEVRQFFTQLAAATPVLILLEDLHWADPASLELFRHVAPRLARLPILLAGTYRVDELTRRRPFYHQLPALAREANGTRLGLKRLDTAALCSLIAARYVLVDDDTVRLTAYLERHAEGNPLFATELLQTLQEERLLAPVNGRWALEELDRVVVPRILRQVIEGRVERLGEEVRRALAIAAIIGQEIPLTLWSEIAGLDDERLLTIVELAVEAHLLVAERNGTHVRFVHALTRESIYEGILPPRRRLLHLQVAEALMAGERPDPDAVAYHLQQAGDARAWEWLVRATDRAQRSYALLTAAERLQAAAELLEHTPEQAHDRARLLHRLGKLRRFSDPTAALAVLDEAERLAPEIEDSLLAAEILYGRGVVMSYLDRFRDGLEAMTAAAEALEAMPLVTTLTAGPTDPWLADALPRMAPPDLSDEREAMIRLQTAGLHFRRASQPFFLASAGKAELAMAIAEQYISALAGTPGAAGGVCSMCGFSYHGLGITHAAMGRPEAARQAWTRSRELFAEYSHHALTTFTFLDELQDVALTYHASDPCERRGLAAEAEAALARAGGAFHPEVSPRLAWLRCLVLDGQWSEALGILHDLPDPQNAYLRRVVTATTALLGRYRGEPEVAWAEIHARFPAGPETAPGDHIYQEGLFLQRLAADLALDANDLAGARAWLSTHDDWLAWGNGILGQAEGRLAWARYSLAAGDHASARTNATEALGLASEPDQPLVRLAGHRLLGELTTARGSSDDADAHLMAAIDLADLCQAPFERALALLSVAELRAAQGASDEAAALLDDVRQTCATLGALPTLARADALQERLAGPIPDTATLLGLTRREVEVLHLLARRRTDKEIAETLYLGPRTIQSHVAHILTKLNVANRREAALKADQLGLL